MAWDLAQIESWLGTARVVWFVAVFAGIVLWAFWPRNRARFERYGRIPLDEGRGSNRGEG